MYLQKREREREAHIHILWTRIHLKPFDGNEQGDALFCIEVFKAEIFIPDEYVVIRSHDVRMQKPFSIPPCDENHNKG